MSWRKIQKILLSRHEALLMKPKLVPQLQFHIFWTVKLMTNKNSVIPPICLHMFTEHFNQFHFCFRAVSPLSDSVFNYFHESIQVKRKSLITITAIEKFLHAKWNYASLHKMLQHNFLSTCIQELIFLRELTRKQKSSYTIFRLDAV